MASSACRRPAPVWASAWAALALAAASPVHACAYDGLVPDLTAAHPRSIGVALAVREALDNAQLQALPPMSPPLGFMRARQLLVRFEAQVGAVAGSSTGSVALLLVESGLWARYRLGAGGLPVQPHVVGPLPGEAVVVTSEAVLNAVNDGSLAAGRASELGLMSVSREDRLQ